MFLGCLPLHILSKAVGPSPWPARFLAGVAWIVGARVRVEGRHVRPHSLLVANHLSWLDIVVLAAATRCTFVSKDELNGFIHWLADQNATIYVRRAHRKGARDQALAIARALERGQPVALFPEGTTGAGDELLPFRSTLFEATAYASMDVEVRPVAIDYGSAATEVSWFNEPAKDNVLRVLGRKGSLPVTVSLLPPLDRTADRKRMAGEARTAIAARLSASSSPRAAL